MSASTTSSSTPRQKVWVQIEGYQTMYLILELHTNIIADVKYMVLKEYAFNYEAFHRTNSIGGGILYQQTPHLQNPSF